LQLAQPLIAPGLHRQTHPAFADLNFSDVLHFTLLKDALDIGGFDVPCLFNGEA
jgi:hypothetical protein